MRMAAVGLLGEGLLWGSLWGLGTFNRGLDG